MESKNGPMSMSCAASTRTTPAAHSTPTGPLTTSSTCSGSGSSATSRTYFPHPLGPSPQLAKLSPQLTLQPSFGYWQDGAPTNESTIVSRTVTAEYWERQCGLYFPAPGTYGSAAGKTVADVNAYTGGWDVAGNLTRLIWTNGENDPWRDATVSSVYRPGGEFTGTATTPVQVIPDGIHCSDMLASNGAVNEGVQTVIDNEVAQIKAWVEEFYTEKNKKMRAVRRQ